MRKTRIIVLLMALLFVLALFSVACSPAQKPLENNNQTNNQNDNNGLAERNMDDNDDLDNRDDMDKRDDGDLIPQRNTPGMVDNAQRRAERLADVCVDVKGVEDATVVLSGDTAYVGLDLEGRLEENETKSVENECQEKVLAADSQVDRCVVASDADTVSRLENVYQGIRQGKPISSFGQELEEIGRRIMPDTKTKQ